MNGTGVSAPPTRPVLTAPVPDPPTPVVVEVSPEYDQTLDTPDVTTPDDPAEDLLALVKDGDYLQHTEFPPLSYALPGLIVEGLTMLVGPPKAGKSWWVLALLLAVACGGKAFDALPVRQRPTLYLALEDSERRLKSRSQLLLGAEPIPSGFAFVTRVEPYLLHDLMDSWSDRNPGGLIVLDTLGKAMPPARQGETTYARDYRIAGDLKAVADRHPGLAVLVNHHDRKAGAEDFVDAVSGTHGLAGAADTILAMKRPRGEQSAVLHVTGRDVDEAEYAMVLKDGFRWHLDGTGLVEAADKASTLRAQDGLGDLSAQVVGFVLGAKGREVRAAEISLALGAERSKVDTYLTRLVKSERITRTGRGRYRSTTPLLEVLEVLDSTRTSNTSNTSNSHTGTPCAACGRPLAEADKLAGSTVCIECER